MNSHACFAAFSFFALTSFAHASEPTHEHDSRFVVASSGHSVSTQIRFGPRVRVDAQGAAIESQEPGGFESRLRTRAFGREGIARSAETAEARFDADRAELARSSFTEWFVHGEHGVEQGWTIATRPPGESKLWIGLELTGDLALRIAEDGLSATLVDGKGAPAARYHGLHAFDSAGRALDARLMSSPEGFGIRVDDANATYPVTVDPWISGPNWSYVPSGNFADTGRSARCAGDVNGDGFSDIVVGAPGLNLVAIFNGSPSGLPVFPSTYLTWSVPYSKFGNSVSTAGDVNGDGYDDVVVGAPFDNLQGNAHGRAALYYGSASGLVTTPAWIYSGGTSFSSGVFPRTGYAVSAAGDVDNNGYDDFVIGIPGDQTSASDMPGAVVLVRGPSFVIERLSMANDLTLGLAVANAGDGAADGYDDLVFGAPLSAIDSGSVFRYTRTAAGGTLSQFMMGPNYGDQYGASVGGGGDWNGDGKSDFVIGAPGYGASDGRIQVHSGGDGSLLFAIDGAAGEHLGRSVAIAGDVNGDGFADIVVGAPYAAGGGRADVYLANSNNDPYLPAFSFSVGVDWVELGTCVAAAGDVNGDGFGDVIVTAPSYSWGSNQYSGAVWVIHGRASAPSGSAWTKTGEQFLAELGTSSTYVGDLNGDGLDDVATAAPGFSNGQTREGRVLVYAGGINGVATTPMATLEMNGAHSYFGRTIAGIGDVDGDGYGELAVGAPSWTNGETLEGAVFVYRGSASGVSSTPAWTIEGNWWNIEFGTVVARAGDLNGDGFADLAVGCPKCGSAFSEEGEVWIYPGSPFGLNVGPVWVLRGGSAMAHFGAAVAAAGDIELDGYGDLIVGAPDFENGYAGEGLVRIYRGSQAGPVETPSFSIEGDYPNIHWGEKVAGIGDVNGDGRGDIAVGCPRCISSQAEEGEVWVITTSGSGLTYWWNTGSGQAYAHFGSDVAAAGDVNADGFGDVIVGAADWDGYSGQNTGKVCVYYGSSSGLASAPAMVHEGWQPNMRLGASVSSAGDVNGDGFADLVYGAPSSNDTAGGQAGRVIVSQGNTLAGDYDFRSGIKIRPSQRRGNDGSKPVALEGSSHTPNSFMMQAAWGGARTNSSMAAGRTKVKWQYQATSNNSGFNLIPSATIAWLDTGAPSSFPFSALMENTSYPQTAHKWRVRLVTDDPFFPRTPWVSLSGRSTTETKIRKPVDCDGNGTADHVQIAAGAPDSDQDGRLDVCETPGIPFCAGDGTGTSCPCGNSGGSGRGCNNSFNTGGAWLTAVGNASVANDTLTLRVVGMSPTVHAPTYLQGTAMANGGNGTVFQDGLLCVSGTLTRMGTIPSSGGVSNYGFGIGGTPRVSVGGIVPAIGGTRYYQVSYRNAANFCTINTVNLSNAIAITWTP